MRISVAVLTYKRPDLLERTLDSLNTETLIYANPEGASIGEGCKEAVNLVMKDNPDIAEVLFGLSEYYYNPSLNAGGLNLETLSFDETGVVNPYLSPLWASNVLARAVQRVAYEGEDAATVVTETQAEIEMIVQEAKELEQ